MGKGKGRRLPLPVDYPIRAGSPTIAIYEEREVGVVEEEFAVEAFDRYRNNVFASNEV